MLQHILPLKYHRKVYDLKQRFIGLYYTKSFSQEGEDLVLRRYFEGKKSGFYIDIGAHHPFRFSNTYLFYKLGWRGINIDAMPGSMKSFEKYRCKDINIEAGVSSTPLNLIYYSFEEPAINGFDSVLSEQRLLDGAKLLEKITIKCYTLESLLDRYLPKDQDIDFMSIDVEGLDLEILKSNNWNKYTPTYLLVECLGADFESIIKTEMYAYLQEKGYKLFAKTVNTCFFKLVKI
jgi:FkbM family methyltransferase